MSYDKFGQQFLTEKELIKMMHTNPNLDLGNVMMESPYRYNAANAALFAGYPYIKAYQEPIGSIEDFDKLNQSNWKMPNSYRKMADDMEIINWIADQCTTQEQLDRVADEIDLFYQKGLLSLLSFLKYTIDTFRKKNIVWGVGRGSSVSSYVLFLIGVHKVDSIKYELDIHEFLR